MNCYSYMDVGTAAVPFTAYMAAKLLYGVNKHV